MFVTVFYGIININTGDICYCNAGHNPPFILKHDGKVEQLPTMGDSMVGALDGLEYHESTLTLEKGDALVMYTDGVTEAMNTDYKQFGEERLKDTLEEVAMHNCQEMVEAIKLDVSSFAGDAEQSDDITVLTLKRL
jgi:sigma-B regulation protein RsbU (phosphoserine phosphatase)